MGFYFTTEAEAVIADKGWEFAYYAEGGHEGGHHNSDWARPRVTYAVAKAWAAQQTVMRAAADFSPEWDEYEWQGNALVVIWGDSSDDEPLWITPDADGLYNLGQIGLAFYDVSDLSQVRHTVGAPPKPAKPEPAAPRTYVLGVTAEVTVADDGRVTYRIVEVPTVDMGNYTGAVPDLALDRVRVNQSRPDLHAFTVTSAGERVTATS